MDVQRLSRKYTVTVLDESDIPAVLALCRTNPLFYEHCPPAPTEESIWEDMCIRPEGKGPADKFYLGFWDGEKLTAVLDLIRGFPDERTAYIGFFMVDASVSGHGEGSRLVEEICAFLRTEFTKARLCYARGNPQSEHFWRKNGFVPTGVVVSKDTYDAVVMEKKL